MRRSETQNISEVIKQLLKEQGLEGKIAENRLLNSWEDVLGKLVSKHTRSLYIKNRTLFVSLRSSIVRNEILMIRDQLVKKLNEKAGSDIIDEIVIR